MLHIILIHHRMVLYFSTGYRVLGIVYLDQLKGACHTHISNHVILTAYLVEYTYNNIAVLIDTQTAFVVV